MTREAQKIIDIVAENARLKVDYGSKKKLAIFKRFKDGKEVERWELSLTDEEFNSEVESTLARLFLKYGDHGFFWKK
jgi:hypothetical protein